MYDWSRIGAAVGADAVMRRHLIGQSALRPVPSVSFSSVRAMDSFEATLPCDITPSKETTPSFKDTASFSWEVAPSPDLYT